MPTIERARLAELLERDPEEFLATAASILGSSDDIVERNHVLQLILQTDRLLELFRSFAHRNTTELAAFLRWARSVSPTIDVRLARYIRDQDKELEREEILKLLEGLSQSSEPDRVSPVIRDLLGHSDPTIRSKAARLLNLMRDNTPWESLAAEPRVLANAIEALWQADPTPKRDALCLKASKWENPRIACNGLLGLYRSGDPTAIAALTQIAEQGSDEFKRSAAWAMGSTADPVFLPVLERMRLSATGSVRFNVLRALARIRRSTATS